MSYRIFVDRVVWTCRVHSEDCHVYKGRKPSRKSDNEWLPADGDKGYATVAQAVFEGWEDRICMVQAAHGCIPESLRASYVRVRS